MHIPGRACRSATGAHWEGHAARINMETPGFNTAVVIYALALHDPALRAVLDDKRPATLPAGGFFLIDPHGNLVLYFSPDIKPRDMVDDVKRLLKLSRIG